MSDKKKLAETNEGAPASGEDLDTLLLSLKSLEIQNRKLAQHQEVSYRWHLQHHNNIKKIISALNRLGEVVQARTGINTFQIEVEENASLLKGDHLLLTEQQIREFNRSQLEPPVVDLKSAPTFKSFHELVLSFRDSGDARTLQELVRNISNDQFDQLQASSTEVILPIAVSWLDSDDIDAQSLGIVILWESAKKFPDIFRKTSNRDVVRAAISGLELAHNPKGVSVEELRQLRSFLKSQVSYWSPASASASAPQFF